MKLNELLLGAMNREVDRSRFALEPAHHRGQLTVYLRLLGAKVPAIYGPSADDKTFR